MDKPIPPGTQITLRSGPDTYPAIVSGYSGSRIRVRVQLIVLGTETWTEPFTLPDGVEVER